MAPKSSTFSRSRMTLLRLRRTSIGILLPELGLWPIVLIMFNDPNKGQPQLAKLAYTTH